MPDQIPIKILKDENEEQFFPVTHISAIGGHPETTDNKVTSITAQSTDDEYPTAKAVYSFTPSVPTDVLRYSPQSLTSEQQAQARSNIGAGTSCFSGAFNDLSNVPTTISGYGITDANISNGIITLGSDSITPLTSYTETDPIYSASAASGIQSSDITAWNAKYDKPSGGIPSSDMSSSVQTSLGNADTAYQKPSDGIPASDIASGVIPDVSNKADKATTLAGYGITDAKIENGVITLGSNSITPLTSFTETDPVFSASAAAGISSSDITAWNGKADAATTLSGYGITDAYTKSQVDGLVDSVFRPAGSAATVSGLGALTSANVGKVYNMSAAFTTTSDFLEGSGIDYPAGTNVVIVEASTNTYKYDVFSGIVDLSGYALSSSLATVATSGSYSDLSNQPTIENFYFVAGSSSAAGNGTSGEYLSTRWEGTISGITTPTNGLKIAYRIATNTGVGTAGAVLSIDGGTTYKPVVYNVNSAISTRYGVGSTILLTYNSTQTASAYLTSNKKTTVTGCWQAMDYSASNTDTKVRQYQSGDNAAGTSPEYPLLSRYALTNVDGTYEANYARFHTGATLNTTTGAITAASFKKTGGTSSEFLKADGSVDGSTYLTSFTETDPTVPSWAKASSKPSYTASEVGALSTSATLSDLSNVSSTSPTDGQALIWDNANSTWKPGAAGAPDAVKYTSQSLTSEQQAQARTNIGAGTSSFSGAFSALSGTPTTIAGYGITDASIANGVITLGSNTITPLTSFTETDPVFSASAAAGITSSDITNWNGKTSNIGTITSVKMNGSTVASSGEADLGTVITSETQLSKGNTTGAGNAVTDISVSGHTITLTKGSTFLTSYTETDPIYSASAASGITSSDITAWNGMYTKPSTGIPASDLASGVIPTVPVTDVTVGGSSVVSSGTAAIPAIPDAVEANPTVPSGTTPTDLQNLKIGNNYYGIPTPSSSLDDLSDVDTGTPSDGDVLTYDSTTGKWVADAPSGGELSTDVVTDKASNAKASTPKSVYDFVKPASQSSQPVGGMEPGVLYNLSGLTGNVTITLATPTDASVANEYWFSFDTSSTAPTITWPSSVTWSGNCIDNYGAPEIVASKHYEVSIVNNYGIIVEF